MIRLNRHDRRTRFFLWCLHHPMCRRKLFDSAGKSRGPRPIEWYIENGTTLCHFFWCCFWVPLITAAAVAVPLGALGMIHVDAYREYGALGLLLPGGIAMGIISAVAIVLLAIVGAGKAGLWPYFIALKQKICPRIRFDESEERET